MIESTKIEALLYPSNANKPPMEILEVLNSAIVRPVYIKPVPDSKPLGLRRQPVKSPGFSNVGVKERVSNGAGSFRKMAVADAS